MEHIKRDRLFIKGEEESKFGVKADYSQATYIMNDKEFNSNLDSLLESECTANDIVYCFYGHLYPYIKAALDDNHKLFQRAQSFADESDSVVQNHAELKFQLDYALQFIADKRLSDDFVNVMKQAKAKFNKQQLKLL